MFKPSIMECNKVGINQLLSTSHSEYQISFCWTGIGKSSFTPYQTLSMTSLSFSNPRDRRQDSNTQHTHTHVNNSDNGHRASARAVHVVHSTALCSHKLGTTERLHSWYCAKLDQPQISDGLRLSWIHP